MFILFGNNCNFERTHSNGVVFFVFINNLSLNLHVRSHFYCTRLDIASYFGDNHFGNCIFCLCNSHSGVAISSDVKTQS